MGQPAAITLSATVTQSPQILDTDLADDVLIMHVDTGKYINLKEVGADIWRMLKEPQTVAALIDTLTADYDVERDVCEKEVLAYLTDLANDGLLVTTAAKE